MKRIKLLCLAIIVSFAVQAQHGYDQDQDILDMSLEDLMNLEVTSASKKAERLQDVMSSIYVLSNEDITNSGATNFFELLRLVPGIWGVQENYSNGLANIRYSPPGSSENGTVLYLLDGTPLQEIMSQNFSVLNFDIPLEEIDRIEIIRGSGGTIYGANSATGVVNIFTKNPSKYDGVNTKVEGGLPGYANVSLRAGGAVSENLAISGYAKYRFFSGWESLAGKDEEGNEITLDKGTTEFVKDYEKVAHISTGIKVDYKVSENTKISLRSHFNLMNKTTYTSYLGPDFISTWDDYVVENDLNNNRLVANLRIDQKFSDNHSLFARISTNYENDFYLSNGGYHATNGIIDFELQDNFSLGQFNDFSIGANYRLVNFDIHDINSVANVNYIDPQSKESISGAFIQDKIKLLDEKLNFLLGIKAENYSLVNSKFYLSPMAKINFKPDDKITFWGGYTQSYTTPGFNTTNIDLILIQMPPGSGINNIGVKNGTNTVPTVFRTFELGVKTNIADKIQFEATVFKNFIEDAVSSNPSGYQDTNIESPTRPGVFADYYLYGNYVKGENLGVESMIRVMPFAGMLIELSHNWLQNDWEYQENPDFPIDNIEQSPDSDPSFTPEHVFQFRTNYQTNNGYNFNVQLLQTSEFRTQGNYVYSKERFQNPIEPVLPIPGVPEASLVAKNGNRTIVNLRVSKSLQDDKLSLYVFGNDITNTGGIQKTSALKSVTISQIGATYGLGLNYKIK